MLRWRDLKKVSIFLPFQIFGFFREKFNSFLFLQEKTYAQAIAHANEHWLGDFIHAMSLVSCIFDQNL